MRIFIFLLLVILLFASIVAAVANDIHRAKGNNLIRYAPQKKIFSYYPQYPAGYKKINKSDTLKVKSQLDKRGYVKEVELLKSTGSDILDTIALTTASKYRYAPGYSEGKPIECWIEENIIFDTVNYLKDEEVQPEIISFKIPEYSTLAYQAIIGIREDVWIKVQIDSSGKVIKAEIYKPSSVSTFNDAASLAAYNNTFKPISCDIKLSIFKYKVSFEGSYSYFYKRNGAERWTY